MWIALGFSCGQIGLSMLRCRSILYRITISWTSASPQCKRTPTKMVRSSLSSYLSRPQWIVSHALVSVPVADGLFGSSVSNLIGPQSLDPSQRSEDVFASPDQLAGELATLTLLPRSRWQTLLKLEVIQVGNERRHPPALHTNLEYIPWSASL